MIKKKNLFEIHGATSEIFIKLFLKVYFLKLCNVYIASTLCIGVLLIQHSPTH